MELIQGDALKVLQEMPENSVDLVLADPPYNIKVTTEKSGKTAVNEWDKIENYYEWFMEWLELAHRVLKENGVLYFWHNDFEQMAEIQHRIKESGLYKFNSFCIWNKGESYRALVWKNLKDTNKAKPRKWFNVCEYCVEYFVKKGSVTNKYAYTTGTAKINCNPKCYKPLKDWYKSELIRLGITEKDIAKKYTEATGKKPHMLQHYFKDHQFQIPTRKVWDSVYIPLGFNKEYEGLRREYEGLRQEYEGLRQEYEGLRQEYEGLRHYHKYFPNHCNVWERKCLPSNNRFHTCQKPIDLLEKIINTSCRENGVVLDPFMGSGSTGIACLRTRHQFIGIEKDKRYFEIAQKRIQDELESMKETQLQFTSQEVAENEQHRLCGQS